LCIERTLGCFSHTGGDIFSFIFWLHEVKINIGKRMLNFITANIVQ